MARPIWMDSIGSAAPQCPGELEKAIKKRAEGVS